ncbi:MAG TPA: glycosyltransferase family 2 protein [Thermoanaerobaculia bacterium]|nr:glycosyltransferase family 2 protein [Thermoanaerobaculia bacterium]
MSARPELSLVVVHWYDEGHLGELLAAVPADPRFEVVVVDNGSRVLPPIAGQGRRLVAATTNLGFAGGANAGVARAEAELLLILNPDARPEPGALEALLQGFARHPEAAGLAPRLLGPDGAPQHRWQLRPLPRPGQLLAQTLFLDPVRGPEVEPAAASPVEQPAAAALALRRTAWEAVAGLDPRFHPAWFEDVDLARRLRDGAAPILYWPDATFRHSAGATVSTLGYGPFLAAYHRNLRRYLRRHHGRGWAAAARALLVKGSALRLALLPLRRPRRAASRRQAAAALLTLGREALTGRGQGSDGAGR